MTAPRARVVGCDITFDVTEPALVAVQVAAAGRPSQERFEVVSSAGPAPVVRELEAAHGGRLHTVHAPVGQLSISYEARVEPGTPDEPGDDEITSEQLDYLKPSRYCPSDHVLGLATSEFGRLPRGRARADAVADWVYHRIGYVSGTSDVHDSAEDTVLTGLGVCRDFAHLGVVLCRALEIPARFAAVYAPGLAPMDFHAVFEAWADGRWWLYDATRRAPRNALVRISTGRDAADTAFATVLYGAAALTWVEVRAVVDGDLPHDDLTRPAVLA